MKIISLFNSSCECQKRDCSQQNYQAIDEIDILAAAYKHAVICLTESWLHNSIDTKSVGLNGCSDIFRVDRNRHIVMAL